MLIKIDRSNPTPIYKQIIDETKSLIDQGVIEINKPLPSTRRLAKKLGVNRFTVVRAYEELQCLGYLKSTPGSYNVVKKRRKEVVYNPERQSSISWERASTESAREVFETFLRYSPENLPSGEKVGKDIINLSQLSLDPRIFPLAEFRRCVNHVLFNSGAESLQYGSHQGYKPLRQFIAKHLRLHGISVSKEEILVTNGAQQALDLIIRLLTRPGKKAAVEAPTYANVIHLLQLKMNWKQ